MTKNPFYNAGAAALYIVTVALVMNTVSQSGPKPDTVFTIIPFLSLLTLSAAFMGYVFFYQPVMMYLDGHKKEAAMLFVRTIGIFAGFTVIMLVLFASGTFG